MREMKTSSVGRQLKSSFPGNFRQNRAIMFQLENLPRESQTATRINCIQVRFLPIYNKYVISSMYAFFQWTLSEPAPNCGRIWPFCPQDMLFSARVAQRCKGHQSRLQNFSSVTAKLCHKLESKMNKETNWLGLTRSASQRINLCPSGGMQEDDGRWKRWEVIQFLVSRLKILRNCAYDLSGRIEL